MILELTKVVPAMNLVYSFVKEQSWLSSQYILLVEAFLNQPSDQTELPAGKFQNGILLSLILRPYIKKDPAVPFLFAHNF